MPPPHAKKPAVTPEQAELLKRWIDEGAKFDQHWAYVKPARPAVPEVKNKAWVRNPIDAFVAQGHERNGFTPAAEADKVTLIRRLSFDLIGLPPTPAEVEAFLKDTSPEAYEKLVDRLLGSKHFGERMAVMWLDAVRYADTAGYHSDNHRDVWLFRDYVIDAFNTNKPFDQFTVEQLAGDLLPNPTNEQKIASGYNKMLMTTEEGGAQAEGVHGQVRGRPGAEHVERLARRDHGLRRVPRPQVRPVHAPATSTASPPSSPTSAKCPSAASRRRRS